MGGPGAGAGRPAAVPALHLLWVSNLAVTRQGALQLRRGGRGVRRDVGERAVLSPARPPAPPPAAHKATRLSLLVAPARPSVPVPARAAGLLPQGRAVGVKVNRLGWSVVQPTPAGPPQKELGLHERHAPVCCPCGCGEAGCCAWTRWCLGGAPTVSPPQHGQGPPRHSRRSCRCLSPPRGGRGRESAACCGTCSLLASLGTGDSHHPRLAQQQPGAGQARGARSALPRTCTGEGARAAAHRHVSRA